MTTQKIHSGISGLDVLLDGGFVEKDAILISGAPGTGKSTIALQYLVKGCEEYNEPGIYVSFEEFPQQLYRDAVGLGFDLKKLEEENKLNVFFTSPAILLEDLQNSEGIIAQMIHSMGAKRIVVDSITAFKRLTTTEYSLREIVYILINAIKREGLTALLLREQLHKDDDFSGEEYVSDTYIYLDSKTVCGKQNRILRVTKSRGSNNISALAYFFITSNGVEVIVPFKKSSQHYSSVVSTGSKEFDFILGGGIPTNSFYLFTLGGINQFFATFKKHMIRSLVNNEKIVVEFLYSHAILKNITESPNMSAEQHSLIDSYKKGDILTLALPTSLEEISAFKNAMSNAGEGTPVFLDLSALYSALQDKTLFLNILNKILELIWQYKALLIANINEEMPKDLLNVFCNPADGVINVWNEEGATYLKIEKSLNRIVSLPYFVTDNGVDNEMGFKI